jgi:hypothetical protein
MLKTLRIVTFILVALASAVGLALAQPQPIEIRCYLAQPLGAAGALTVPDITFQQSNLRKRYVCPDCGYSSDSPGQCPDPWNVDGGQHPQLVDTEAQPGVTGIMGQAAERVVNVAPWDMGDAAHSDIVWHDSTGATHYLAVVGQPFHPETLTVAGGSYYSPLNFPDDPRSYMYSIYIRMAITLPVDTNGDGDTTGPEDIHSNALLQAVVILPNTSGVSAFPAGDPAAVVGPRTAPTAITTNGVFDATAGNNEVLIPKTTADIHGVGRVFLRWQNPSDHIWRWNADTTNAPSGPPLYWSAFYVSRLQVPWTANTWRQGSAEQTAFDASGAYTGGSFLARVLVGNLTGVLPFRVCDDLFMPGATTPRRNFTLVNRASDPSAVLQNLQGTLIQSLSAPPGVSVAGRGTPSAAGYSDLRPALPDNAVRLGPTGPGQGQIGANAVQSNPWVQIAVPANQPSSEGGNVNTLTHVPLNNWGYRGLASLFDDSLITDERWTIQLSDGLNNTPSQDQAEEFCPFDLQLSVDKQTSLLGTSGATTPGRVAPGVPARAPDTTVGDPRAIGRTALASDVAHLSPFTVANQSNVTVVPVPLLTNQAQALPVTAGNRTRSLARLLGANPVWMPFLDAGNNPILYSGLAGPLLPGLSGAPAGWGTVGSAGLGWRSAPGLSAANDVPLPFGQALGQYSGTEVYFQDLLAGQAGGGVLYFISGLTGLPTNTGVSAFDPTRDEPLEPVAYAPTSLRVTETRLPFNDFYSADSEPVLRFDYTNGTPTGLQFIWAGNRATPGGSLSSAVPAPAATDVTGAAMPSSPFNLLYGNATLAQAGDYRNWLWDFNNYSAFALTNTQFTAAPGSANYAPETFNDAAGQHWVFWNNAVPLNGGAQSTLHWEGSTTLGWVSAQNAIYAPGVSQQGLRGFATPIDATHPQGSGVWLFWTEGLEGHQSIHYRWNFTGASPTDANEAALPVTNAVTPDQASDLIADFSTGQAIRKPPAGPFVYTKDPCAFLWTHTGLDTQVHVVFSGYLNRQQHEAICWAAYDMPSMQDPTKNYGKLTFPRVADNPLLPLCNSAGTATAGEQLEASGMRQVFTSRHLDWLVTGAAQGAAAGTADFATNPLLGTDPHFYLGLIRPGGATPDVYDISWTNGVYNRARGVYHVTPTFTPVGNAPALPWANSQAPNPLGGGGLVTMDIEPASGTVTFSAPLYNPANWADTTTVFGGPAFSAYNNVALYADYTPFIFRVTTSDANDNCPNAFAEVDSADPNQLRLVFLWRRVYAQKDTPQFGRTGFMCKTWTLGTQVGQPPFTSGAPDEVQAWKDPTQTTWGGQQVLTAGTDYTFNPASGIVSMLPDGGYAAGNPGVFWLKSQYDGSRLRIAYNGSQAEEHRVLGWSRETPVPVDTVQNEGPLRALPEVYTVSTNNATYPQMSVVRYWLTWASPRPVYDLRLPAANSSGSVVQQSSGIYCATVVPAYDQDLREQEVDWQNVQ